MPSRNTVEIVIQAKDEASQKVESIFSGITGQVAKVGLALQGMKTIIDSTVGSLSDMARSAATSMNVQAAFAGKVKESGKSVDEMLAALQKGSAGMITNTDLMKSYNTAAQLVGTTFANQLPDAMGYLTKVAAATGQDMSYMMDSLVRGVGRLSPMILDNLGIQVDVISANETYAASIGKTVDSLTKEEQQTALMNQVLEKLKTNTAAMPDVTDSAAAKFAQFDVKMKNLRGTIGRLVLPAFIALQDALTSVVNIFEMLITGDFKSGIFGLDEDHPVIVFFLELRNAIMAIAAGVPVFDALWQMLSEIQGVARDYGFGWLVDGLQALMDIITQVLKPIGDWISKNIELKDVLIAFGLVAASIIIPALISIGTAIAGILAPIALIIGAVALFRKVWEDDIGGVRTFITDKLLPALAGIFDWFATTAVPAIVGFITNSLIPALSNLIGWIGGMIDKFLEFVRNHPDFMIAMGLIVGVLVGAQVATMAWTAAVGLATGAVGLLRGALSILFGPIGLIIGAITLMVGWLSTQEGGLAGALSRAATAAQQLSAIFLFGLLTAVNWVKARFDELVKTLQGVITWIDNAVKKVEDFLGLSGGLTGSTGAMVEWARQQPFAQQNQPRALGGRGLPGMGYNTEPDEVFVPDRPGRFMRDGAGGNGASITIQFNGTGGPSSQGEADAAGAMIVNSLRNLGVPVRA